MKVYSRVDTYRRTNALLQEEKIVEYDSGHILYTENITLIFPGDKKLDFSKRIPPGWRFISFFDMFPSGIPPMKHMPYYQTYKTGLGACNIVYGDLHEKGACGTPA